MHILYIDESETYNLEKPDYFILAGVSVFERQTYWLSKELDEIAAQFHPDNPNNIELHGSPMFGGSKVWRGFPKEQRVQAIKDVLNVLAKSHSSNRIFASIVEKGSVDIHPISYAFQQLATRFDYYLGRVGHTRETPQRGMILFDKSSHETTIQSASNIYRNEGHQWGKLKYLAEVPAFIDSKSSRLIQLADIVAFAINRKWARDDEQFYKIIQNRFDSEGDKIHGLHIKTKK